MLKQGTGTLVFNVCTRLLCSRKTAAQKRSTHETIQDNTEQELVQADPWVTITRAGRWAGGTLVGGGRFLGKSGIGETRTLAWVNGCKSWKDIQKGKEGKSSYRE